ncbi:MAG: hypothetical protein A6F71_05260 [Cycloclasticus sp. symbiont of Poecilosclerida sp. M]|nr:MAG: hypothetical protein A6F71_05260 [Cycloclasticus sp. symbiont of Poecilosclerida sp. M]
MSIELFYLTAVALLTAAIWVPYTLNYIIAGGLMNAVGPHADIDNMAPWAVRMKKAHANAIENLVIFAALVLVVHADGANNDLTAMACMIYFWARVVHLLTQTFGIPWVRTLAFAAGFGCQIALGLQIL